jgi:Domain of unknown function (DUF4160)
MVTKYVGGVRFVLYPQDHVPRHAHALTGDTEIIIDLRPDRSVALADRDDAVRGKAKKSDIQKVLRAAAEHFDILVAAWEQMHDES